MRSVILDYPVNSSRAIEQCGLQHCAGLVLYLLKNKEPIATFTSALWLCPVEGRALSGCVVGKLSLVTVPWYLNALLHRYCVRRVMVNNPSSRKRSSSAVGTTAAKERKRAGAGAKTVRHSRRAHMSSRFPVQFVFLDVRTVWRSTLFSMARLTAPNCRMRVGNPRAACPNPRDSRTWATAAM